MRFRRFDAAVRHGAERSRTLVWGVRGWREPWTRAARAAALPRPQGLDAVLALARSRGPATVPFATMPNPTFRARWEMLESLASSAVPQGMVHARTRRLPAWPRSRGAIDLAFRLAAAEFFLLRRGAGLERATRAPREPWLPRAVRRAVLRQLGLGAALLADVGSPDGRTSDPLRRLTGWFGLASVGLWLSQFPLYMQGDASGSVYEPEAGARDLYRIRNVVFTRILLNLGAYVTAMAFAAGFADLIRRADPEAEWLGTLVFGAMAVWLGVTLVANGLEGGAVLDTLAGSADPSVVRALTEGYLLIYNGSIAFAITGLFLGAAGYATTVTGVLPRWTAGLAYAGAALCAAMAPAMYGGAVDFKGFYNAGGWGPVIVANFPSALWFVSASLALLRGEGAGAPRPELRA